MTRSSEWRGLGEDSFRTEVAAEIDRVDRELVDVRQDLADTKELNKWMQRTMIGLLVSMLLVAAGMIIR